MRCPSCHQDQDRVIDSRASDDGGAIRRRRECLACKRRYTTYERVEQMTVKVIKKDGARVPFDRAKLKAGIEKACWKRPIPDARLEEIVSSIESDVESRVDSEVESRHLGEMVMHHLRQIDQVAYVRFASVYRQFEDVQDFVDELWPMLSEEGRSGR